MTWNRPGAILSGRPVLLDYLTLRHSSLDSGHTAQICCFSFLQVILGFRGFQQVLGLLPLVLGQQQTCKDFTFGQCERQVLEVKLFVRMLPTSQTVIFAGCQLSWRRR